VDVLRRVVFEKEDIKEVAGRVVAGVSTFFVSYLIQEACFKNSLHLLRIDVLLSALVSRHGNRPPTEEEDLEAFPLHFAYGWHSLVFTMALVLGLVNPLVLPPALLYLYVRYYIEKYNIIAVYARVKREPRAEARLSGTFVVFAAVLCILCNAPPLVGRNHSLWWCWLLLPISTGGWSWLLNYRAKRRPAAAEGEGARLLDAEAGSSRQGTDTVTVGVTLPYACPQWQLILDELNIGKT